MNPDNPTLRGPAWRADRYNKAFPKRPPLVAGNGMMVGTWMIGACYKNPNPLYGAYPHGYLERVHAMFPDARSVLHVFSGGLTLAGALEPWHRTTEHLPSPPVPCMPLGPEMVLVDVHGPEQGRHPTHQADLFEFCTRPSFAGRFDLILADPPYSAEDAVKYDVPMVNRGKVMNALRRVAKPGGNLVWLDQVWPMHRKDEWKTWGTIGLLRSTNHRVRMVSFFEAV